MGLVNILLVWLGQSIWAKKKCIEWMLGCLCDLGLYLTKWPWSFIFKVKFWISPISGMRGPIDSKHKGYESIGCGTHFVTLNMPFDFSDRIEKPYPRNGVANGQGTKGCESIASPTTHFLTLIYHLELWFPKSIFDLGLSRSNFEKKTLFQEWDVQFAWDEMDVSA